MLRGLVVALLAVSVAEAARVVCYWDGQSFWREGIGKVTTDEVKDALQYCTHLIYGFAGIEDKKIKVLDEKLNLDKGKGQYRSVVGLKRQHPSVSILLSVGGFHDTNEDQYFYVLEKPERRTKFINSVYTLVKDYGFDGVDLAWQFPAKAEKRESGSASGFFHKLGKTFGIGIDDKWQEHRDQFVALVREMKAVLRAEGRQLSIGVLPHINNTLYYDIKSLMPHVDMVNLWTVDFRTPQRVPNQADYSAPLYFQYGRLEHQNVDYIVRYWTGQGADLSKLNLGIPTYGITWKLGKDSPVSGVPPLLAHEEGEKGTITKTKGKLAYYEICTRVVDPTNSHAPASMLRRFVDPNRRLGTYAYRLPSKELSDGLWVSYEEPETSSDKANYAKQHRLGGVALIDISMDDSRGNCNEGQKFPIVRAAKLALQDTFPPLPAPKSPGSYRG